MYQPQSDASSKFGRQMISYFFENASISHLSYLAVEFGVFSTNANQVFFAKFMTASKQLLWDYFRADVLFSCNVFLKCGTTRLPGALFCRLGFFAAAWSASLIKPDF